MNFFGKGTLFLERVAYAYIWKTDHSALQCGEVEIISISHTVPKLNTPVQERAAEDYTACVNKTDDRRTTVLLYER